MICNPFPKRRGPKCLWEFGNLKRNPGGSLFRLLFKWAIWTWKECIDWSFKIATCIPTTISGFVSARKGSPKEYVPYYEKPVPDKMRLEMAIEDFDIHFDFHHRSLFDGLIWKGTRTLTIEAFDFHWWPFRVSFFRERAVAYYRFLWSHVIWASTLPGPPFSRQMCMNLRIDLIWKLV